MISGVRCWPRSSGILTRFPLSAPSGPPPYLMLVLRLKVPPPPSTPTPYFTLLAVAILSEMDVSACGFVGLHLEKRIGLP